MPDTMTRDDVDVLDELDIDLAAVCYSDDCDNPAEWEVRCRGCGFGALACDPCLRAARAAIVDENDETHCTHCSRSGPFDEVVAVWPWPGGGA